MCRTIFQFSVNVWRLLSTRKISTFSVEVSSCSESGHTGPTLASLAEVLPSPPIRAQPTALHELELNLVIYPVFLFVSPWVNEEPVVCVYAFWLSRSVTSWRHPHSSLSNIYKEEMSRHNSVNTMTWRNEVRTMGSSLIVAVCACQHLLLQHPSGRGILNIFLPKRSLYLFNVFIRTAERPGLLDPGVCSWFLLVFTLLVFPVQEERPDCRL